MYSLTEVRQRIVKTEQSLQESLERDGKKRSGSYYTPDFIVEYMVNNSISQAIVDRINSLQSRSEFRSLNELIKCQDTKILTLLFREILPNFMVCDIAMGWGVFLLHTFDFFFSFYLAFNSFIVENMNNTLEQEKTAKEWIIDNIISNNICGVDLSPISAELANLKLIEKALLHLNQEAAVLPNFNLFTANSLLDKQIFSNDLKETFNKEYFDVIIGNPPYINVKKLDVNERRTYSRLYQTYNPNGDISNVFWERSLELCKQDGRISLITPRYWLEGNDSDKLREYLLSNSSINEIIDFRSNRSLFLSTENKLGVDTAIISIKKHENQENNISVLISLNNHTINSIDKTSFRQLTTDQNLLSKKRWTFEKTPIIKMLEDSADYYLGDDKKHKEFSGICHLGKGCSTGNNKIFKLAKLSDRIFEGHNKINVSLEKQELSALRLLVKNSDISKFKWTPRSDYWIYLKGKDIEDYPNIKDYLSNFTTVLERTQKKYGLKEYYDYAAYRSLDLISNQLKVICPYQAIENRFALIADRNVSTINETDVITLVIKENMREKIDYMYLLSVLNSELIQYFSMINNKKIYNLYDFRSNQIANFPIKKCNKQLSFRLLASLLIQILRNYQESNSDIPGTSSQSLFSIINAQVYELYFEDLLSTELNETIEKYFASFVPKELDSLSMTDISKMLKSILDDDSVRKDLENINNLIQVQDIRKFIKLYSK
ncbi:MAG: N-6 DNA methylase [Candidatus Heimdallarchaeota archaeon]|nr:N-6 DNA methylase [Candidatus Heimdallarchaeota archaeon]